MLKTRSSEIEIMDDLSVSGETVSQTLRELHTINKYLGGNTISLSSYKKMIKDGSNVLLADLGCGGADILKEMNLIAQKGKVKAKFVGIDANPFITNYAIENTKMHPEITFNTINVLEEAYSKMKFDIIHCCLFLHHFSDDQLVDLFRLFKKQARIGVIVNDLHRHPLAYWSIKLLTTLFSKSTMVKNDACLSVSRGFTRRELETILCEAGISSYTLKWKWAFRWCLTF